jgi:hypothetical protein
MDGHVSKDLFQIDVGESAIVAPLEVPGTPPSRLSTVCH